MKTEILTPDRRVRVFVSSRIEEFSAERRALVRLITHMGLQPICFEEIPTPHPPRDLYEAYLSQSEVFLGIYGEGYGWVDTEGGMTISGIHDEWILSDGMPRIIFVKDVDCAREPRLEEFLRTIRSSGVSFNRFKTIPELIKRARSAIAQHVSERYLAQETLTSPVPPNYIDQLTKELEAHPIVATRFFTESLLTALASSQRVFVEGSPGAGKTVSLYQIAKRDPSAIYLSLRNQSLFSALLYFIRRLETSTRKSLRHLSSASEALIYCETVLRKVPSTLLIDDVDQTEDVAARLATLAPGKSHLVFAGRFVPAQFQGDFRILRCNGFTPQEAEHYIRVALGSRSVFTQAAVERSLGKPLYLRYFVESPELRPAVSLDDYHSVMWSRLDSQQKELIGVAALSEVPLEFELLVEILSHYRGSTVSGIRAHDEVQRLGNLLSIQDSRLRIFHPAFRDFVCMKLDAINLSQPIHRALANAYKARGELFLQVVHSVRGGMADTVYDSLQKTAAWAEITGRIKVARQILASVITLGRKKHDWMAVGLALQQSADIKQHTRNLQSALLSARLAEKTLLRSDATEATIIARSSKALFLLEVDRGDEAQGILKEVLTHYSKAGLSQPEAVTRLNLAFLYVRRGRMADAFEQCEKARVIFEANGDSWGAALALLNAQNYYIAAYDRKNQVKCFKKLLILSKALDSPRLEISAYNGMTVYYRRENKLTLAERYCHKAITLAKNMGLWDVELTNVGNLGNVYRDKKEYDKARECYEQLIITAIAKGSKQSLAFGKEQLACVMTHDGNIHGALALADEALVLWREIGHAYREAVTEADQGARYRTLGRHFESGKSYERATMAWIRAGIFGPAASTHHHAVTEYLNGHHYNEAVKCFELTWSILAKPEHATEAITLLDVLMRPEPHFSILVDLHKLVETVAPLFSLASHRNPVVDAVTAIAAACKRLRPELGQPIYLQFLHSLAKDCPSGKSELQAIALAFAIEQAPPGVIESATFNNVCHSFADRHTDLRYRNDTLVGERWTLLLPTSRTPAIEIEVEEKAPAVRAAVAVIAILTWVGRHLLVRQMGKRKWRRIGFELVALSAERCKTQGIPIPSHDFQKFPCVVMKRVDPADDTPMQLPLIISEGFLAQADQYTHPDNRCSPYIMYLIHETIIQNFTKSTFPPAAARKYRDELMRDLFGMRKARSPVQSAKKRTRKRVNPA